ncbi:MAG: esterase-like activity of phytase family protein [Bdellovibrionota bacterium]
MLIFRLCTGTSFCAIPFVVSISRLCSASFAESISREPKQAGVLIVHRARVVPIDVPPWVWSESHFLLSFGSGLARQSDGTLVGVTDRGPIVGNECEVGQLCDSTRYGIKGFRPLLVSFQKSEQGDRYEVIRTLPIGGGSKGSSTSVGKRKQEECSQLRRDPEGVSVDASGTLWIVDEATSSLLALDPETGEVTKSFSPGNGLPKILNDLSEGRGFEGLSVDSDGALWIALQSPLEPHHGEMERASVVRFVKVAPETSQVEMYAYPLSHIPPQNRNEVKISALEALSDKRLLFIERNVSNGEEQNFITVVSVDGVQPLKQRKKRKNEIESAKNVSKFQGSFVKTLSRTPLSTEWCDGMHKFEGVIFYEEDGEILLVEDTDFGVSEEAPCGERVVQSSKLCILSVSFASGSSEL